MSCCSDVMEPIKASSCCTPKDTAARAAQAMRTSGCGCAPVVEDAERLTLVGVVTERDVYCSVAADDAMRLKFASKRSCGPRLPVVGWTSQLTKRDANSTSIMRRACPS
jgi:CBS-domain-containing membrane protein